MRKEFKVRLINHITFLENEIKDYSIFFPLTWEQYNADRSKRRDVERWIENIINSSIDIAKVISASEGLSLPDTYRDIVASLSLLPDFEKGNIESLSRLTRLRNIISHEYLDIRWTSIKRFISESKPLIEAFMKETKTYLEKKDTPED